MSVSRRKFIKNALLGGASFAGTSGIYFPKPVEAVSSVDYVLSMDATSSRVFGNFQTASIALNASDTLPSDIAPSVIQKVKSVESELSQRQFNENRTPYAQRLGNKNQPFWGNQKKEQEGPNPGFGTIQIVDNRPGAIAFTGATTAGIDSSIKVIGKDYNLNPLELDSSLVPIKETYQDWGSWAGDIDPRTGQITGRTSFAEYETRFGKVRRKYRVIEPGPGGFGEVTMYIDSRPRYRYNVKFIVRFL